MSGGRALGHWEVKDCKSHKALSVCKQSISSYHDVQLPEHHIDAYAPCPPGWESHSGLLHCFKVGSSSSFLCASLSLLSLSLPSLIWWWKTPLTSAHVDIVRGFVYQLIIKSTYYFSSIGLRAGLWGHSTNHKATVMPPKNSLKNNHLNWKKKKIEIMQKKYKYIKNNNNKNDFYIQ